MLSVKYFAKSFPFFSVQKKKIQRLFKNALNLAKCGGYSKNVSKKLKIMRMICVGTTLPLRHFTFARASKNVTPLKNFTAADIFAVEFHKKVASKPRDNLTSRVSLVSPMALSLQYFRMNKNEIKLYNDVHYLLSLKRIYLFQHKENNFRSIPVDRSRSASHRHTKFLFFIVLPGYFCRSLVVMLYTYGRIFVSG